MRGDLLIAFAATLVILAVLVASFMMLTIEEEDPPQIDLWPPIVLVGPTAANVHLGHYEPHPNPTDLKVILELNGTHSGVYRFQSNDDDILIFESGTDIATIHYGDLADNQHVNPGDVLKITDLYPDSDYTLKLI